MKTMRRKDREIPRLEAEAILAAGAYGVLSTVGEDGQPYGVPVSYTYKNNCIYFHCAAVGHKIENIQNNPRVSFCVVGNTRVMPAERTVKYESAIVFGVASEVQGPEKDDALLALLEKYSAEYIEEGKTVISEKGKTTTVIKIEINHISGKAQR
ncbi:MAG: Pyridoxamine 5'-phosphate oxidase [Chloroflexi bacterium ADurb.Bin360]|nr:MAG: Pyridoxamine 5'-phosphate oxidase [Chloroflexi bacterium ADurb.Bin360]